MNFTNILNAIFGHSTKNPDTHNPKLYALIWGMGLWLIVAVIGGRAEAWDSPLYALIGFPFMMIGAGVLGWYYPQHGWRHGFYISLGQGIGIIISGLLSGAGLGLFPLTIIAVLLLSLPFIAISALTAFIRNRIKPRT